MILPDFLILEMKSLFKAVEDTRVDKIDIIPVFRELMEWSQKKYRNTNK